MRTKRATTPTSKHASTSKPGALLQACREGGIDLVRRLIEQGEDPNVLVKSTGSRPLTDAVRHDQMRIVELLLASGADPDLRDTGLSVPPSATALEIACRRGHLGIAKLLLRCGADIDRDGYWPPLKSAISYGQADCVRLLLRRGARWQSSWLVQAFGKSGETEITRCLIEAGADVNCRTSDGITPLHFAVRSSDPALTKLLLRAGANANVQSHQMGTPLSRAAEKGNLEVIRVLLQGGADVALPGPKGKSAEHWARAFGHMETAKFLREYVKTQRPKVARTAVPVQSTTGKAPARIWIGNQPGRGRITMSRLKAGVKARWLGASDFVAFVHEWSHPEWLVLGVEAPLQAVASEYCRHLPVAERLRSVAITPSERHDNGMGAWIPFVQPTGSEWTVVLRVVGFPIETSDVDALLRDAALLSKELNTRALSFIGAETSFAMQCDLFDRGKPAGTETWGHQGDDADKLLKRLGFYIPACYSYERGRSVCLRVWPSSKGKILAAELVLPKE